MSDGEIRQIKTDYEKALAEAMAQRDQRLRNALDSGRKQVDLIKLTGWSRETVRQALDPAAREAARQARAAKKEGTDG